ncbi:MAG: F0F1 ATP synthase subunit gamma [Pseudomonadota bacterium]|nr:F0F1 ATP synthase subunit gamma [Pseudomonadota bacterium]MED5339108.1 F0F1 ATP synthase subunit gamma [Pseudomonadota bacterium]MEE3207241.1 F0F1 ATP synthase subunit gamma [Pseudomonadota bacterium]MEE3261062.1 F0F1 ATP synthase subunit gamma [Pseudomonadota bacterium]
MANLKDLRNRISSVKSTQKITSAMKMVAAAKLRRAQEQVESARPYAEKMQRIISSIADNVTSPEIFPPILMGREKDNTHLIIVSSSDRGLCGGFNTNIIKAAKELMNNLENKGKKVKFLCVGKKGKEQITRFYKDKMINVETNFSQAKIDFSEIGNFTKKITEMFDKEEFDSCTFIYAKFRSAIQQDIIKQKLIPFTRVDSQEKESVTDKEKEVYDFEPQEGEILPSLIPANITTQIFHGLLENYASEQGARMTAMDSATRNASDMIDDLTLFYNRTRQAVITKELIEIISGAEAV